MKDGESRSHEEHKKRVSLLREDMHKKLAYYAQKPVLTPEQLYGLVKEFFLSLLEKEYEPTYEELVQELHELDHEFLFFTKQQREDVARILEKLSRMHYSNEEMTSEQSSEVLKELGVVISDLTTHTQGGVDRVLQQGLRAAAKKDFSQAKQLYLEAHRLINKMGDEQKKQYHPELSELYQLIS
ncbi:MAG: hypothetical protein ACMXYD_03240 [Candidatus Woesearchaeota archaeon]